MTPKNLDKLKNIRGLLSFIPSRAGTGEGLVTAVTAGAFTDITNPLRFIGGLGRILGAYTTGRLYLSDFAARTAGMPTIREFGMVPSEVSFLRLLAEGMALSADLAEKDAAELFPGVGGADLRDEFEEESVDVRPIPFTQGTAEEFDAIEEALSQVGAGPEAAARGMLGGGVEP
jgi:hypothetical protein